MWNQTYLVLLGRILEFDLKLLCPWKDGSDKSNTSKLIRGYGLSSLVLPLIMVTFVYFKWQTLTFIAIAENLSTAILYARSFGYTVILKKFYSDYKKKVDKLLSDRSLTSETKELSLTERYCKTEFGLTVIYHLNVCFIMFCLHAFVYILPNQYQLIFNCYIFFLPPDGSLFAWELNYLVFTVATAFIGLSVASFVPLPFILMNQSCWLLDMALITTGNLDEVLQQDEDIRNLEREEKVNENMKKFVERCGKFVEWQSETQGLLFWYFNLEFQLQSLILCLSIYVLTVAAGGIVLIVFSFCAIQLFVLCWMGERVTGRIDQLSFEISKNWYLMTPKQRKVLQMILHWTQNMEGFSGLFKDVSLETCKAIFEASYSFYTFLQSTNGY